MPDQPPEADMSAERNAYLDQVVAQQVQLEQDLRSKRSSASVAASGPPVADMGRPLAFRAGGPAAPEPAPPAPAPGTAPSALDVRVSGFWRWKTVLVPPNAFVVHTRRGRADPVNIGL